MSTQYRISWEMPPATMVALEYEKIYGADVWPTLTPAQWRELPWGPHENVRDDLDEALEQYNKLREWAGSHEQPIRNVKIEQRHPPAWEPLTPPASPVPERVPTFASQTDALRRRPPQ